MAGMSHCLEVMAASGHDPNPYPTLQEVMTYSLHKLGFILFHFVINFDTRMNVYDSYRCHTGRFKTRDVRDDLVCSSLRHLNVCNTPERCCRRESKLATYPPPCNHTAIIILYYNESQCV